MRQIEIAVYVNQADGRFFHGYRPGDSLSRAVSFAFDEQMVKSVAADGVPRRALGFIFEQLNIDAPAEPWAMQWRRDGHPSMSVGDVVVVGESAYALSRRDGWVHVNLDAKQFA